MYSVGGAVSVKFKHFCQRQLFGRCPPAFRLAVVMYSGDAPEYFQEWIVVHYGAIASDGQYTSGLVQRSVRESLVCPDKD